MDVVKKLADKKNLQDLVPLNALSDARFAELARKIVIEEVRKGRYLFRTGDRDNQSLYLLDGKINLIDDHRKVIGEVEAGMDISRYPIANQQPRTLSARAVTKVVIARIDSGLLDVLLTWDQTSSTEVTEIGADNNEDWMSQMLQSEAFIRIPPAAIQRLLIKMQSLPVDAGEVVISQGEEGDYFYTIHKGRCAVTRKSADGMETKLAELANGDCFGEEALVSDARRNATITMLTDGMLMCLAKKDFVELLQKPLVKHVDHSTAGKMIEDGAVWIDVRSTGEFENVAFEDSVNIPLSDLRGEMPELVYNAKYIICCDTGRRSVSAAFILSHKGFEVYVLDGGMNALSRQEGRQDSAATAGASDQAGAASAAEVIDFNARQEAAAEEHAGPAEVAETGTDDAQLQELAVLRDEVEILRQQLNSRQETEQQLVDSNGQIDTLQEQKDLLREQYAGLQEEHDKQVQQLVEQLEAAKEQLTGLQAQTEAVDLEKQRQLGQFEREQEDWQLQIGELEQQLAGLREQYEVAVAERAELSEWQEKHHQLQEILDAVQEEKQGLDALLNEQQQSRSNDQQQLQDTNAQLDRTRDELLDLQQKVNTLQAENRQLEVSRDEQQEVLGNNHTDRQAAEQQLQESVASVEAMRMTATEQENILNAAHQEAEVLKQQLDAVQQELLSAREQSQTAAQDHEASLQQAYDDLKRENDTEKDMQGQISRLRKKLEQSATDLQQAREDTREQVAQVKEELRAERKARTDERADLAARQKELKEQLVAITSTHEELLSRQEGALAQAQDAGRDEERARLKDMLDNQAQAEAQLETLQAELEHAHEQADLAVSQEHERNVADIALAREQKAEAETVVAEQETRLQELTAERDAAVTEQQSILEQLNSLRAEVEVARGLIGDYGKGAVEDPVNLRAELEDLRRNMDIAMRVRSEAEVARDRALAERDALQHQLDETGTDGMPLQIPSLDEQPDNNAVEAATAWVVDCPVMSEAAGVAAGASGEFTYHSEPDSLANRLRAWLGKVAGLAGVAVAAFGFWYMLNNGSPMIADSGPVAVEVSEPVAAEAEAGNNSETTEAVVTPQPQPVVVAPEPEPPAVVQPKVVEKPGITPVVAGRTFSDAMQDGGRGPAMVSLPAAAYMMGSSDASPNFAERPQHRVDLPAFAISKHEVSFAEYDRFARATGRRLPYDEGWGRADRPVINVSWKDATAYVAWLSKQTGHNYRLPSEAQWEFAARAGSETPHWWPRSAAEIPANCFDCGHATDGKTTVPVGNFTANGFGLLDTAGNVQEWTQDCHHRSYKGAPSDGSAWQSADCSQRVVRGGAYTSPLASLRGTKRAQLNQGARLDNLGFRVVRSN
ncbi:MAG: SUMF1/EgtB/PvdO family nonheme iron enzyme [Pseudomonadota bacterium]